MAYPLKHRWNTENTTRVHNINIRNIYTYGVETNTELTSAFHLPCYQRPR